MAWRTLLSREESYAIHALMAVLENPGTSTACIAEQLAIPPAFLAKVIARLVKADLMLSREGRRGGLWLKTSAHHITLLRVLEALSGSIIMDPCQAKPACANEQRRGSCALKQACLESTRQFRQTLNGYTLAQIAGLTQVMDNPTHPA